MRQKGSCEPSFSLLSGERQAWLPLQWRLLAPTSNASRGITVDLIGGILGTESSSFLESPFLSRSSRSRAPSQRKARIRYPEGTLSLSLSLLASLAAITLRLWCCSIEKGNCIEEQRVSRSWSNFQLQVPLCSLCSANLEWYKPRKIQSVRVDSIAQ